MSPPEPAPAKVTFEFLQAYDASWVRFFPKCPRKIHWHVLVLVCTAQDEVPFSRIRGRMDEVFGLAEETLIARTNDLLKLNLLSVQDSDFTGSTIIEPSAKLSDEFGSHMLEAAHLLRKASCLITRRHFQDVALKDDYRMRGHVDTFFRQFHELWATRLNSLLRKLVPNSPTLRLKAKRATFQFPYWHVLTKSWEHRSYPEAAEKSYLLVDDFHQVIYRATGVGYKATSGYVQDLLDWGFLERLGRNDGVPNGKFAVRITNVAFDCMSEIFSSAAESIVKIAASLEQIAVARNHIASEVIVEFRAKENVSGTLPIPLAQDSGDEGETASA